jgi:peptide/nickel transport system permease protein
LLRAPITLSLAVVSILMTIPVGVTLGIFAAYARGTWWDALFMIGALLGVSLPGFWIAILSVSFFSVQLGWLPSAGYVPLSDGVGQWLAALVQPAAVLALFQIGYLARVTRSAMLEVMNQDYIRTARAKGAGEFRTIGIHALRNAMIQVLTATGVILSLLIGGAVVIEQVFALPGIGRFVLDAILRRDYPVIQGTMLLLGISFVFLNIVVDAIYAWVDPRIGND